MMEHSKLHVPRAEKVAKQTRHAEEGKLAPGISLDPAGSADAMPPWSHDDGWA
jgi:hypothetical protein